MLRLLKQEDFALLLVSELASSPHHLVSLTKISEAHGVSPLFLKKLARDLKHAGIIESKEGSGGGYKLTKSAKSISVFDVLEAVQGKRQEVDVPSGMKEYCPLRAHCLPQTIRKTLGDALRGELRTISLYDLTQHV